MLSGGKSTRMGMDKGVLSYHGVPQREYLYHLLEKVCDNTFLSIRSEQEVEFPENINTILDKNEYRGPFNGLLSAHYHHPNVAWLVLACDLPLMDLNALKQLMIARDPNTYATAFATEESGLPEPLAAIWEPNGLKKSIDYLKRGAGTCPRKFLINSDITLVIPKNDQVLLNANSQEDYKHVLSKLTLS